MRRIIDFVWVSLIIIPCLVVMLWGKEREHGIYY